MRGERDTVSSLPDRVSLERAIGALVKDGAIRLDGEYIVWESAVYALVDCVFSARANYSGGVLPMLRQRLASRLPDDPDLGFSAFIADVDRVGPDKFQRYAREVLTRQKLARRLKVEICYEVAQFFVARGLERKRDFRSLDDEALEALLMIECRQAVRGIGLALARYLLMLLGREDHIKPDVMMTRFFASLSEWVPRDGHAGDADIMRQVVRSAAAELGTTAARLDNAIWRYQRDRRAPKSGPRERSSSVRRIRTPPLASTYATPSWKGEGEGAMAGGHFDSSRTRVRPVFDALKASGTGWVRGLLELAQDGSPDADIPADIDLTVLDGAWGEQERALDPPVSLLAWLIRNLTPPSKSTSIDEKRKRLLAGDPDTIAEALRLLRGNPATREWYIFEGPTVPDALITTPDAVIVVEGKRTERGPTTETTWLPNRHQIWRHIDAAWEGRGRRRVYGMLIVESETGDIPDVWRQASRDTWSAATLKGSFPHRSVLEVEAISSCFLGVTTWRRVCERFGVAHDSLPATIADLGA